MMEWVTIAAIILGPIAAVLMTRFVDGRRERHERRMAIFRDLMRNRRNPLVPDFVGALNLIEIEFQSDKAVIKALRDLMKHFGTEHVRGHDERVDNVRDANEVNRREERLAARLGSERAALITKLLHSIATVLRFKIEQLEILEGGYSPQGWYNVENEQAAVRRYFIDLAEGRRVVPIAVINGPPNPRPDEPTAIPE